MASAPRGPVAGPAADWDASSVRGRPYLLAGSFPVPGLPALGAGSFVPDPLDSPNAFATDWALPEQQRPRRPS